MTHQLRIIETGTHSNGEETVLTRPKAKLKRPSMYKVILLNDDYTPMDFVVYVLERFFNKSSQEAIQLMLDVHNKGSAVCGIYTYEIAEAKHVAVLDCAEDHGHPLECTIEKE
ncbi:MAG: ATP-dependent Clp protease adapter ClpS [Pseudomonadota bacterium]